MKLHKWDDIKRQKLTPEQIAQVEEDVDREIEVINLQRLGDAIGHDAVFEAAKAVRAEPESSEPARVDLRLAALRCYVEALGGEIEIVAVVNGKRIPLAGV